jgi:hypothetical protein
MHYLTLIEELYQAFYDLTDGKWEDERDNETEADYEIKKLIGALAHQLTQVYRERLVERAQEQEEESDSSHHSDTEQCDADEDN